MFKSLKTPIKLGFLLTFLMAFILTSYLFSTKYYEYNRYQQAEKVLPFSIQIDRLIGSLADERDLHNLKLSKLAVSSEIRDLAQQLSSARVTTDSIIHKSQILNQIQIQYPSFKPLVNSLRKSKNSFQAYTSLIQELINFHKQVLNQAIFPLSNTNLVIDLDNLYALRQLREYSGEERGLMMQVLFFQTLKTQHYFKLSGVSYPIATTCH